MISDEGGSQVLKVGKVQTQSNPFAALCLQEAQSWVPDMMFRRVFGFNDLIEDVNPGQKNAPKLETTCSTYAYMPFKYTEKNAQK